MRSYPIVAIGIALASCGERAPDFARTVESPAGTTTVTFLGYQPRGPIEGYLTVTLTQPGRKNEPQLTFGHMLNVRAGWLDDHTFALVYDVLEPRHTQSPVYPTGEAATAIEIVHCNTSYLDCTRLLRRIPRERALLIKQFPEGSWPKFQ